MPSPQPDCSPSYRLAARFYRALASSVRRAIATRYDTNVRFHFCTLESVSASPDCSLLCLRVECRGLTQMPARLLVTRPTQRSYTLLCTVQNGSSQQFSYTHPPSNAPYTIPVREHDAATFLRTELENRLGRLLLNSPAGVSEHDRFHLLQPN